MSDDLVKLEWKIRSERQAEVNTPFGSYVVQEYQGYGWRWFYCFDTYYDEGSYSCEDMAHGMSLAEEHWRDRAQPITKPLTDHIEQLVATNEELEAKLSKAVEALKYYAQDDDDGGWLAKSTLAAVAEPHKLTGGKDDEKT